MNWERVQTIANRHGAKLAAKRIWVQQFGAENGFGIAARWDSGRKRSVMVSRSLPDKLSDVQLDRAIAAAVGNLAEKVGA